MKIPANGFTHAGKFHADDVFATALLQILRPDIKITRGFTVPDDFDGIVYDIGFGMFDHHQEPREYRANGVPYAAFGLLWRVLGPGLVGERQARLIDENFIQPLDLNDNTGEQNSLCDAIGFFNPVWDSKEDGQLFFQAGGCGKADRRTRSTAPACRGPRGRKVQQAYRSATASWCCPAICRGKTVCTRPTPCLWCTPASAAGGVLSASPTTRPKSPSCPSPSLGRGSRRRSSSRKAASRASASATPAVFSSPPRTRRPPLRPAVRC